MTTVLFPIEDVVNEVYGSGQRAEHDERHDGFHHGGAVPQLLGEHERAEDEQILRPLPWTERIQEVQRGWLRR